MIASANNQPGVIGRLNLSSIDPYTIDEIPGWNSRRGPLPKLEELADQIAAHGSVLEPITVRRSANGRFELLNGHRRLAALKMAIDAGYDIKGIPAHIRRMGYDEATALQECLLSNDGIPFSMVERADVYHRLQQLGFTQEEIATKNGVSQATVAQTLKLIQASDTVIDAIDSKKISATDAIKIITKASKEANPYDAQQTGLHARLHPEPIDAAWHTAPPAPVPAPCRDESVAFSAVDVPQDVDSIEGAKIVDDIAYVPEMPAQPPLNKKFAALLLAELESSDPHGHVYMAWKDQRYNGFTEREMQVYTMGRMAVLCEQAIPNGDLEDLPRILEIAKDA